MQSINGWSLHDRRIFKIVKTHVPFVGMFQDEALIFLVLSDFNQVVTYTDARTNESRDRDRPECYTDEVPHWNVNIQSL